MSNSSYNFLTQRFLSFFFLNFHFSFQKAIGRFIYILQITFYVSLFSFLFLRLDWDAALKGVLFPGCYFACIFSLSIFACRSD
jgi:hypothetical protein